MTFSTNPYGKFHKTDPRESIGLNETATVAFAPARRFDLKPDNFDPSTEDLDKYSKQYCHHLHLSQVPTTATTDKEGVATFADEKKNDNTYI